MHHCITVTTSRAAAIFNNLRQRQILCTLIGAECSLGELADRTQTPLNLLHHHVRKFISLGLAEICATRPRAGAPIKVYRATAKAFLVPAALAGVPTDALNKKLRCALERRLAMTYKGVIYTHDGKGVRMQLVRRPESGATVLELWAQMELCEEDAAALAQELSRAVRRYSKRSRKSRPYIVHAALVPA